MADRHVRFALGDEGQAPYALQLRITPQMLAAIRTSAAAAGTSQQQQQHSIQLDSASNKAVVTLGGQEFQFKTLPDKGCSVLKTNSQQGIATVQGSIVQKLQPVRTLAGSMAAAAAAAEAAVGKERAALPLPASLPAPPVDIISPLDRTKGGLPLSTSLLDQDTLHLLRNGLAEAAAKTGIVRFVLIALLAHRPTGLRTIKTQLETLQQRVPQFKCPQEKGEVEQLLKKVAAYKAPGNYVLNSGLENEIESLLDEAKTIEAARKVEEEAKKKAQPPPPSVNTNKRKAPSSNALPFTRTATPTPGSNAINAEEEQEEDPEERSLSPAARRKVTPSLPSSRLTTNINEEEDAGTGTVTAASRPLSSSSRGSGGADESWVLEHAQRLPEPSPLLTTPEDYFTTNAEFHRRYLVYFKLHQLLSANRRDFEALQAAVDDAPSIQEKEKIEGEVERLWTRRARRARQWEVAFQVLHEELAEWKNALSKYASSAAALDNIETQNNAGGSSSDDDEEEEKI